MTQDLLVFSFGPQQFALPVHEVSTVVPRATLTPLPGAPSDLIGLLRLRGALYPVIDVRARLGVPAVEPHIGECIVVLHTAALKIGLLVERVEGVVATPPLDATDRSAVGLADRLIRRVVEVAGHVVAILDFEAAIGSDVRAYLAATADGLSRLAEQTAA